MTTDGLRTRLATPADAVAIAAIYNEGIADRIATFRGGARRLVAGDVAPPWRHEPDLTPDLTDDGAHGRPRYVGEPHDQARQQPRCPPLCLRCDSS
jgi:hypothetical protein